jgi:hypothetical protein
MTGDGLSNTKAIVRYASAVIFGVGLFIMVGEFVRLLLSLRCR